MTFKPLKIMKAVVVILLVAFSIDAFAQDVALKKGNTVYIHQVSANDQVKDYQEEFTKQLEDWRYWKIADNKENADMTLELKVDSHKGITLTSWGGQTVAASILIKNKNGEKLWQSETFETSPNGTNGFNGGKGSIRKILKALKDKFK